MNPQFGLLTNTLIVENGWMVRRWNFTFFSSVLFRKEKTDLSTTPFVSGWESRRRRTEGHDYCLIKLGLPGRVVGVDIDTSYFNGNHPHAVKLEGVNLPSSPVCILPTLCIFFNNVPHFVMA
jgi:allantoicase